MCIRLAIFVSWFSLLPLDGNIFETGFTRKTDTGVVDATTGSKTKVITNRKLLVAQERHARILYVAVIIASNLIVQGLGTSQK